LTGAVLLLPERADAIAFIKETVDAGADVGQHNSLALDSSGNPHIAYWDFFFGDLEYAVRVGGVWSTHTVDATASSGQSPSIALDSSGNPRIAYLRVEEMPLNLILMYAEDNGGGWSYTTFDLADDIGLWPSLALDSSDDPHISHYDLTNRDLIYQYWDGIGWTIERVDTTGWVGGNSSLALDSLGRPHISYYDLTNQDLKYAAKIGGVWMVERVDSLLQGGSSSSLALDSSDTPHIGYYAAAVGGLLYAVKTGGNWQIDPVDLSGDAGINVSLILDSSDRPHMSYHEGNDDDLLYATGGIGSWMVVKLDSLNEVGFDSSIQLDANGLPRISYYDFTVKNLLFTEAVHPLRVPDHFATIQQAINAACAGDSILVAPGFYSGSGNRNLNFGGKDLVLVSEGGMGAASIDGGGVARGFSFGNGETSASVVDGFSISGTSDAGIFCSNASPTIRNCDMSFVTSGSGIVLAPSFSLVEDCVISNNRTSTAGPGIRIVGGAPNVLDCEIRDNESIGSEGGGISIRNSAAVIESCLVFGNRSDDAGGGVYIEGAPSPSILGCTFESNRAGTVASGRRGGAIQCFAAPVTISGCRFRGNSAEDGGAISLLTFSRNEATIEDCLFAANRAFSEGGALRLQGFNATIQRSTIVYNTSDDLGGGIHLADDDTIHVERTILWENCAGTSGDEMYFDSMLPDIDVEATFVCCDVDSLGFAGPGSWVLLSDNFTLDPQFVEPGNCGLLPDWPGFNLDCGSPCLAAASPCGETIGAGEEVCVVAVIESGGPEGVHRLLPSSPNPFSSSTQIRYELARPGHVSLRVYDLRGRAVRELFSGSREAGPGVVVWDGFDDQGRRLASGIYFIRLRAGELTATLRTVLLASGI
jgi:hypothetical protein